VKDPDEEIIIEGYGDSNKTNRDDKILSKLRAEVVKDYFLKRGISDSRIKTCWMGSENRTECHVSKEDKDKTHQVEFKFKLRSQE
jgi:outer membrane protein OmpA-like peptidoglycan-associated protein